MSSKTKKVLAIGAVIAVGVYLYNKSKAAGAAPYVIPGYGAGQYATQVQFPNVAVQHSLVSPSTTRRV